MGSIDHGLNPSSFIGRVPERLDHSIDALSAEITVPVQRCAVYPPSIVNVWPVTNAASSDSR
jgi:hypothetical protein